MSTPMHLDTHAAVLDPETHFERPDDLATHVLLTRGQKLAALNTWAFNVRARLDAVSEGMPAPDNGADTRDISLLNDIESALQALQPAPSHLADPKKLP